MHMTPLQRAEIARREAQSAWWHAVAQVVAGAVVAVVIVGLVAWRMGTLKYFIGGI
jgi:hypothetical protein